VASLSEVNTLSDRVLRIFLYAIIFGNLLLGFLWCVFWLFAGSRRPSLPTKLLWRDITWLICGLIGWCLFSRRLLDNIVVFFITFALIGISTLIEILYQRTVKRRANGAT
jgi:hypothetical protein